MYSWEQVKPLLAQTLSNVSLEDARVTNRDPYNCSWHLHKQNAVQEESVSEYGWVQRPGVKHGAINSRECMMQVNAN